MDSHMEPPWSSTVSPRCPHCSNEPVMTWGMLMAADRPSVHWHDLLHICPLKCIRTLYILLSEGFLSRCSLKGLREVQALNGLRVGRNALWGCLTTVGVILAKLLISFRINIVNLWIFGAEISSCFLRIPLNTKGQKHVHIFRQALC